jgi:spore coat polysaccharide biosynthesis protein SpsF
MKIQIIIQARYNSTRLPGKILLPLGQTTVLGYLLNTARSVGNFEGVETKVTVAVPKSDLELFSQYPDVVGIDAPEDNLTERFKKALDPDTEAFIRLTSDCPFVYKELIQLAIIALKDGYEYVTNATPEIRLYPDGLDIQGITVGAFNAYTSDHLAEEHLFANLENAILRNTNTLKTKLLFPENEMIPNPRHKNSKLSLDTKEDYARIKSIYESIMARASQQGMGSKQPSDK